MKQASLTSKLTTKLINTIPFCLGLALVSPQSAQALSITPTTDGAVLVDAITGSGINIDSSSINFLGASGSAGIFTDGNSSGIGINSGIILTTGQALDAVGTNNFDFTGTINGSPGDKDLDFLADSSITPEQEIFTSDAAILEFRFEAKEEEVALQYVFASEEYNEFDNLERDRNDVLGFFLNGQNIALIPGTNIPVSVSTVNDGNNLSNGDYSRFYNNNDPSDGGPFFDIEYDGFTDVFTAKFLGLTPGFHTLKLAIADGREDSNVDSAVFIASNSVVSNNYTPVPEPTSIFSLLGMMFLGSTALSNRKKAS